MLCLSGFELYSRWVPLLLCMKTNFSFKNMLVFLCERAYFRTETLLVKDKREIRAIHDSLYFKIHLKRV